MKITCPICDKPFDWEPPGENSPSRVTAVKGTVEVYNYKCPHCHGELTIKY